MSTMHEFDPNCPRPTDTPKFTPRPWYAVPDAHSEYHGCDVDLRVRGESSTVALVPEDGNGDANARLIASAPELYAALQVMVDKAVRQNWNDNYPEQLAQARAALAKVAS